MTPEARAARERKQKIFVVAGGLFLVVMMAIQLPRLLGGSGDTAAATTTTSDPTLPGSQGASVPGGSPVSLVDTSGRRPAVPGKLTVLGVFEPKDPFVQQVVAANASAAPASEPGKGSGKGAEGGESKGFSTGVKSPATPALTIVSVNGARQTLEPGVTFPATDPVFVLVSEQPGSKAVVIGVVGGAYAGGSKTTKLKVGRPLTLVNTTTGAKYKVSLVSVGSGDAPEQAAPSK